MLVIALCTFLHLSIDDQPFRKYTAHAGKPQNASLLSKISDWGKANHVLFNASKTQFLHLSTRHNLPNDYPLLFIDTQPSPSPTLNILGLSFTCNLNRKFHISLAKTASMKLGVLSHLRQFFSPP